MSEALNRTCPRCGEDLPLSEFSPDPSKASGYKSHCKGCERERSRLYYKANRERKLRAANERNRALREAKRRGLR